VSIIALSSGTSFVSIEAAHHIASKLWKKRLSELEAELPQIELDIETKRQIEQQVHDLLDEVLDKDLEKS
jgi:hypothetical protein